MLDKESLIYLLKLIRTDYSQKFSVILRINRKKRRAVHRGGREYRNHIKELKDQAKEYIQRSLEDILAKNGLNEDVLAESYKHFENDNDVKSALSKLCMVESSKVSSLVSSRLEQILEAYISRAEEFAESDPNELNIQMKMLEDDIFEDFGCEPEEIEAAVNKNPKAVAHLIKIINELNEGLLEKTNQELFY